MVEIGDTKKEVELKSKEETYIRPITFIEYKDGAIGFSTDFAETFIYLYKDQVKQLKKLLRTVGKEK